MLSLSELWSRIAVLYEKFASDVMILGASQKKVITNNKKLFLRIIY